MSAWKRRREAKKAAKARRAYDRLHGRGAVSRAPRRRRDSDWGEDLGELIVDIALAIPRGFMWFISKILE